MGLRMVGALRGQTPLPLSVQDSQRRGPRWCLVPCGAGHTGAAGEARWGAEIDVTQARCVGQKNQAMCSSEWVLLRLDPKA